MAITHCFLLFTLQVWRLLKQCRKSIILHFKDKKKKQEVCSAAVMKIIYHFLNWGYSQKTIWKVPQWLVLRSELLPSVHIASSPHRNTSETYMLGADMELNWSALLYCCIAVQWPRPHMSHHRQQQHSQFNSTLSLSTSLNQCLITRMTSSANYCPPPPPPHPPTFFSCQLCLWCSACSSSKATTGLSSYDFRLRYRNLLFLPANYDDHPAKQRYNSLLVCVIHPACLCR